MRCPRKPVELINRFWQFRYLGVGGILLLGCFCVLTAQDTSVERLRHWQQERTSLFNRATRHVQSADAFKVIGRWPWGPCEAAAIKGELAFIGNGQLFQVLDLSDPSSPTIVGEYQTNGYVFDIRLRDSLALCAIGNALLILDITNPQSPQEISQIPVNHHVARVALGDSIAFIAGFPGMLSSIDIRNVAFPTLRGQIAVIGEWADVLETHAGYVYYGSSESWLQVYDARNPDTLKDVSAIELLISPLASALQDTLLFVGGYHDQFSHLLQIVSIARPDTGITVGSVVVNEYPRGIAVRDSSVYLTLVNGDIVRVNIATPSQPVVTTRWKSEAREQFSYAPRHSAASDSLLVVAQYSGLRIANTAVQDSFIESSYFPTGGEIHKIRIRNNHAFIASGRSGLWILDVSDPQHPIPMSNLNLGSTTVDLELADTIVFLMNFAQLSESDTSRGLWIVSISDIENPKPLSHHIGIVRGPITGQPQFPNSIAYDRNLVVTTQVGSPTLTDSTIEVIDVSDPFAPQTAAIFRASYKPHRVFLKDSLLYIAQIDSGLRIVSLANPSAPLQIGRYPHTAYSVIVADTIAFLLDADLVVLDVRNAVEPFLLDSIRIQYGVTDMDVAIGGNYLYWAEKHLGVVDISNPADATTSGLYLGREAGTAVDATGDTVFYGEWLWGMTILRNTLVTKVRFTEGSQPTCFELHQNYPNPFNGRTTIEFSLPIRSKVSLRVYNILGEIVAFLQDGVLEAGNHTAYLEATHLSSGLYFYQLRTDAFSVTKRFILMK